MTTRPAQAISSALLAKGMTRDENHHTMYRKDLDGVTTLVTRISHGSRFIGDHLASLMANQCALRLKEFWELVDCSLTAEQWDVLVAERCDGGRNPFMPHR